MTFLAVVVVLIFSFAFVLEGSRTPAPVVAGIIWIALVVSGTVGLGRAFDRERDGEAIRSLLLTPAPRAAIYLGKLVATVALMAITETALTAPVRSALLRLDGPGARPGGAAAGARHDRLRRRRLHLLGGAPARARPRRAPRHAALPDHRPHRDRRRARHHAAHRSRSPPTSTAPASGPSSSSPSTSCS